MNIGICITALVFSGWCVPFVFGSDSHLDEVVLDGESYSMNHQPLEVYWKIHGNRPKLKQRDSFFRDNWAKWIIENGKLQLLNFEGTSSYDGKTISKSDLFPGEANVTASWFTGIVLLVKGIHGSGAYNSEFPEIRVIQIYNGRVLNSSVEKRARMEVPATVGLSLKVDRDMVFVKSISEGSPAERSEAFSIDDRLLYVVSDDWGKRVVADSDPLTFFQYIKGRNGTKVKVGKQKQSSGEVEEVLLERRCYFTK